VDSYDHHVTEQGNWRHLAACKRANKTVGPLMPLMRSDLCMPSVGERAEFNYTSPDIVFGGGVGHEVLLLG